MERVGVVMPLVSEHFVQTMQELGITGADFQTLEKFTTPGGGSHRNTPAVNTVFTVESLEEYIKNSTWYLDA